MNEFKALLCDLIEYRDHCYCTQQFEAVKLLDRVAEKLKELEGYAMDDEDNGEPELFDENSGLRFQDTF